MLNADFRDLGNALTRSAPERLRTVELVEDDPSVQRAIAMALRDQGFAVVVHGSRQAFIQAPRPEGLRVVLLDMRLADGTGLEICDWLAQQADDTPVVFISGQSALQEVIDALKGGAHDFLLKPVRLSELLQAIEGAFQRQQERADRADRLQRLRARWARLTRREQEVCVLMLKGMANREIALLHGSVPGTVKVHRSRVLEKMEAPSLSELFRQAAGVNLQDWLDPEGD